MIKNFTNFKNKLVEELSPETYKSAANKLKKHHPGRSRELMNHYNNVLNDIGVFDLIKYYGFFNKKCKTLHNCRIIDIKDTYLIIRCEDNNKDIIWHYLDIQSPLDEFEGEEITFTKPKDLFFTNRRDAKKIIDLIKPYIKGYDLSNNININSYYTENCGPGVYFD